MDYGTFRGIVTVGMLLLFIGIFVWAYSAKRKKGFDAAAQSIFDEQEQKQQINKSGEEAL